MCWACGGDNLEDSHAGSPWALTTTRLQGVADKFDLPVAHVVANQVKALGHYNPALTRPGRAGKSTDLGDFLALMGADGTHGTVLKANDEDRFLLMVAYSPNRMPLRGADHRTDLASPRVLEKACWAYMSKGARTGMWHEDGHDGEAVCVENYIYRNQAPWDVHGDGSLVVQDGDWIVGFILTKEQWGSYKAGLIGGVSMQGAAGRKPATDESIARARSAA